MNVTVNENVEKLMKGFASNNALNLGARRSGVNTALKRFYEYSARLSDTADQHQKAKLQKMIKGQAENVLANGLYILSKGGNIESGKDSTGLFYVTVKLN